MTVMAIVGVVLLSLLYMPTMVYLCVAAGVTANMRTRQRLLSELIRDNVRSPLERDDNGE